MQLNKKVIVRTALCAVLVSALGYSFVAKSETKLIPFQGKLTDASGQVISDGAIVVQFKMYDAPVGGQAKWNGEVQMLSVNGGLVNTTLGTKASLKNVDFSSPTYLEITIDANGDNQIGPEDPPLLPRQSIIPAVYAAESGNTKTLGGYDWSVVFTGGDPVTGKIDGAKLADKSISYKHLANNAVTAAQITNGAITSDKIAKDAVSVDKLEKKLALMIQSATPPGTISAFGGEDVPIGWMLCDGRPLSSKNYPDLYRAISTNWGAGYYWEGTSCLKKDNCDFNLPDLRGLFLRGVTEGRGGVFGDPDSGSRIYAYIGGATGDYVGSYQKDALQVHSHKVYFTELTGVGLTPTRYVPNGGDAHAFSNPFSRNNSPTDLYAGEEVSVADDIPVLTSRETRPRNAYVNYIIKCDTQISDDNPVSGKTWIASLKSGVNLEMNWVEPGTFTMGSSVSETGHQDNETQHQVTLSKGFWLGKYEVTQGQYEAVMGNNPNPSAKDKGIGENYPVNNVSYNDALTFCRVLTEKERAEGRLSNEYKYTLPTEAQWEYACRAGTTTALYNGDQTEANLNEVAWYGESGGSANGMVHIVGQKQANSWGFYDMYGNVWEWCLDWYGEYPNEAVTDPTGASTGSSRIYRGGGWKSALVECCSAMRGGNKLDLRVNDLGFRVALVPVQ